MNAKKFLFIFIGLFLLFLSPIVYADSPDAGEDPVDPPIEYPVIAPEYDNCGVFEYIKIGDENLEITSSVYNGKVVYLPNEGTNTTVKVKIKGACKSINQYVTYHIITESVEEDVDDSHDYSILGSELLEGYEIEVNVNSRISLVYYDHGIKVLIPFDSNSIQEVYLYVINYNPSVYDELESTYKNVFNVEKVDGFGNDRYIFKTSSVSFENKNNVVVKEIIDLLDDDNITVKSECISGMKACYIKFIKNKKYINEVVLFLTQAELDEYYESINQPNEDPLIGEGNHEYGIVEYVKLGDVNKEETDSFYNGHVVYLPNENANTTIKVKIKGAGDWFNQYTTYHIIREEVYENAYNTHDCSVAGSDLLNGYEIEATVNSKISLIYMDHGVKVMLPLEFGSSSKTYLYVVNYNPDVYHELESAYKKVFNVDNISEFGGDKLTLDIIDLGESRYKDDLIAEEISKILNDNSITVKSECNYGRTDCYIKFIKDKKYIQGIVKYKFTGQVDESLKDKVETYVNAVKEYDTEFKFPMGMAPNYTYYQMFNIEDLENINFLYNHGMEFESTKYLLRYSSEFNALINNSNFDTDIKLLIGESIPFGTDGIGETALLYNGEIVGTFESGASTQNKIYVPDDTPNTREAFIKAAEDRIKEYLKTDDVVITYVGKISEDCDYLPQDFHFDLSDTLDEYYKISINGEPLANGVFFVIIKDSSRMQTGVKMITVDLDTDIKIETESAEVPLESTIKALMFSTDSGEYKNMMNKLKTEDGIVVDLKVFSRAFDGYITKLDNGKFKVYIPLKDNKFDGKDIVAVYVKTDGTLEKHPAVIEDGYAVFETDHFSTYAIVGNTIDNPPTGDNIMSYCILLFASFSLLVVSIYVFKRVNSKNNKE